MNFRIYLYMKAEKKYNYFYIINNLLNGHFYLGVHSTDNLDDDYFGSGTVLKQAIKKHGRNNFELTILQYFDTRKEVLSFEKEIVTERFLEYYRGVCYNVHPGGDGGSAKQFTDEELRERRREQCRGYMRHQYTKDELRERYERNKEKILEYQRGYQREYYERNKEKILEYQRQRYHRKKQS